MGRIGKTLRKARRGIGTADVKKPPASERYAEGKEIGLTANAAQLVRADQKQFPCLTTTS